MILSANLKTKCVRAIGHAIAYIRDRQSPTGGFCFYRHGGVDEPSLGDTYYAVSALKLLNAEIPAAANVVQFLSQSRLFGLTYLYFYVFTLDRLGLSQRIRLKIVELVNSLIIQPPDSEHRADTSAWLESARKTIRLQQHFGVIVPPFVNALLTPKSRAPQAAAHRVQIERSYAPIASFVQSLSNAGGFGERANLWDTYLALSVLSLLGVSTTAESTSFVDSLQQPPFGFAMSDSSTMPSLDVVYAGVRCCELLALPVRFATRALEFTLACQTSDGGFAHAPVALPNLEFTYRAMRTLVALAPELVAPLQLRGGGELDRPRAVP